MVKIQAETSSLEKTNSTWPVKDSPNFTSAKDVPQKKETENNARYKNLLFIIAPTLQT